MKLKVVPEPSERWTTAMASHGSLRLAFSLAIAGIVPLGDLAEEDVGERLAVENQVAGLDAGDVDDRHDAAHHHRELDQPELVEFGAAERRVGRAEGDGLGLDLLDAATRTDRLVVETDAGLRLVGVSPFCVDRVGEGGASTGDVGGIGVGNCNGGDEAGRDSEVERFHLASPVFGSFGRRLSILRDCVGRRFSPRRQAS